MAGKNLVLYRWQPDYRYREDKLINYKISLPVDTSVSVTDKESYKITLASMRGMLAQGAGSPTFGSYSIPAGKEYDPNFDFSFVNRPDLTIVELDNFIAYMKSKLENSDDVLAEQINNELELAQTRKSELEKKSNKDTSSDE